MSFCMGSDSVGFSEQLEGMFRLHGFLETGIDLMAHHRTIRGVVIRVRFFDAIHHRPTYLYRGRTKFFFDGVGAAISQIISSGRFECVTLDTPRHHHPRTKRSPGISIIRKLTSGDPLSPDSKFSGWFAGDSQSEPFLRTEQKASFK